MFIQVVGHLGIQDSTTVLSSVMTVLGSSLLTTALPDTIMLAPACTQKEGDISNPITRYLLRSQDV